MQQLTLGKSGLKVSAIGFGGIPIQRISDEEACPYDLPIIDKLRRVRREVERII